MSWTAARWFSGSETQTKRAYVDPANSRTKIQMLTCRLKRLCWLYLISSGVEPELQTI